jgi:hypothetical protein
VTHVAQSLDPWGSAAAVRAGEALLANRPGTLQNQHLMGWGVGNPEPSPGKYDWSALDRRVALMRRTRGTPVITLCCAPDWMKGGTAGTTDWSNLEAAPLPEHVASFAELARQTALRYPDVKHFMVWNEMKGFWDPSKNRWRYEDYTKLYNAVYDALKSVDPTIKVGGPYVSMISQDPRLASHPSALTGTWGTVDQRTLDVISYWLAHAHGADFVAVDGSPAAWGGRWLASPADSMEKLRAINRWIRQRSSLPIWWSELYAVPYSSGPQFTAAERTTIWQQAMRAMNESGASVVLFWQPESGARWTGLWTPTDVVTGGRRTTLYDSLSGYMRPVDS